MTTHPLVTIGIPVYNEEKYLADSIESAMNQSYQNIEIIISDNASTDHSYQIAQSYKEKDKRIKIIRQKENIGVHENFCFLLNESYTPYFLWLGAHDILDLNFIKEAINTLETHQDYALIYPKSFFFKSDFNLLESADADFDTRGLEQTDRLYKILNQFGGLATALHGLFRTNLVKKVGFDKYGSDHLLILAMSACGHVLPSLNTGYYRRIVREENEEEREKRYQEFGYTNNFSFLCAMKHFEYLFFSKDINSSKTRQKLMYDLGYIVGKDTLWGKSIRYFIFHEFKPLLALNLFILQIIAFFKRR